MARHADITLKEVAETCEQIRRLDQRPTVDRVYALLKKGSRTTINKLLREHLKAWEEKERYPKVELSSPVMIKLKEAIAIANQDRDESIKSLEEAIKNKEDHIQEILKESEEQEKDFALLKVQHSALKEKHQEYERTLKQAAEERERLQCDLKSITEFKDKFIAQKSRNDTIAEQISEYKKRIKELEAENRSLLERAIKAEK